MNQYLSAPLSSKAESATSAILRQASLDVHKEEEEVFIIVVFALFGLCAAIQEKRMGSGDRYEASCLKEKDTEAYARSVASSFLLPFFSSLLLASCSPLPPSALPGNMSIVLRKCSVIAAHGSFGHTGGVRFSRPSKCTIIYI